MSPAFDNLPPRIAKLPKNERGYPVPWFVAWIDGKPDFRVISSGKRELAVTNQWCWICGERLGAYKAFVIGPMCAVNRISSEPPCHQECAEFAATACPFLVNPEMLRRPEGVPEEANPAAGIPIDRNPGVALVWTTKKYEVFRAHGGNGGWLIKIGEPEIVKWFCEGRAATREEVLASIESGTPLLMASAESQGSAAVSELTAALAYARGMVPA